MVLSFLAYPGFPTPWQPVDEKSIVGKLTWLELDIAWRYLFIARERASGVDGKHIPVKTHTSKRVEMFLDGAALERSSAALRKTEDTLRDYEFWQYFDEDIKALYDALLELAPALRALRNTLVQEIDLDMRDTTVKGLQSYKEVVSQLPSRLLQIRSEQIYLPSKRSTSQIQIFEDREKLVDSFRTRTRRKLHKNVLEFREIVTSVLEDFDL